MDSDRIKEIHSTDLRLMNDLINSRNLNINKGNSLKRLTAIAYTPC